MEKISTSQEKSMLLNFFTKSYKPNQVPIKSTNSDYLSLSDSGRIKLENDLNLLMKTNSLPYGLSPKTKALLINGEQDQILTNSTKQKLIEDLTTHLVKAPTIIKLNGEGHTILDVKVIKRIKRWLEYDYANDMVKPSK